MTKEGRISHGSFVKKQVIDFLFLGKMLNEPVGYVLRIDGDKLALKPQDVAEIAAYLNLTERHAKRVIGDLRGLVKKTYVRHGFGRPKVVYSLTQQGIRVARKNLDETRNLTDLIFMRDSYAKGDQNEKAPESYGFPEFEHFLPIVKMRVQRCPLLQTIASYEKGQNYKNCVTCSFRRVTIEKCVVCDHPGSGIPLKRKLLAKYVNCFIKWSPGSGMEGRAYLCGLHSEIEFFDCDHNFMEKFWALLLSIPRLQCDAVPWFTKGSVTWNIEIKEPGAGVVRIPEGLRISPSKVRRKFERWKSRNPQLFE